MSTENVLTAPGNEISHQTTVVNGVRLHYVMAGSGEPLVLLHGFPQTWREWHQMIPTLAKTFTVIAPDLRGFGDSDKPSTGYDKRTVAEDIYQLVHHLGFEDINLVGHDIGMMVAYEYASAHPNEVSKLAMLEAGLPGLGLEALFDSAAFPQFYHFGFFRAPGLAEALVAGREKMFITDFIRHLAYDTYAVTDEDLNEYAERLSAPGALRASFEHYRAFDIDAINNQQNAQTKLPMPVLAVGGQYCMGDQMGLIMAPLADNVQSVVIERSGHWLTEEQPEQLTSVLVDFFAQTPPKR
ncbi:alpha/beta fold hydrolase [Serratia ficaria]|uniref:Soluble epoxide hydrolase n=1 Tax=Serratia ficaria TaxID=61651 RepID=A0A240AMH3_SERFI|nr:alpha/beta hydrolase [Serratia ficaria]REF42004.1 pimeloyl-ACP methyl ester carboxylesterase [Serratia ficaria]CAI0942126.1 Soluble epoxide hydrolase [Serratia ficaria]CAI0958012.1 Soluble epoxide hydrolase [Serratia ficaria]CAI1038932.1 Soluble epoxide hydrolase [Serratia ficaria]CAI2063719.1 Soluble epoxide hydrolase [Serratia ficaria]